LPNLRFRVEDTVQQEFDLAQTQAGKPATAKGCGENSKTVNPSPGFVAQQASAGKTSSSEGQG
jgi:hypothetical protein